MTNIESKFESLPSGNQAFSASRLYMIQQIHNRVAGTNYPKYIEPDYVEAHTWLDNVYEAIKEAQHCKLPSVAIEYWPDTDDVYDEYNILRLKHYSFNPIPIDGSMWLIIIWGEGRDICDSGLPKERARYAPKIEEPSLINRLIKKFTNIKK